MEQALLEGATANGFIGELWTLDRVALVIQRLTGVQHHPVARFGVTHVLAAVPGDRSDPTLRIPALRRLRHTAGAPGRLGHPHPPAPPGRRPRPAAGGRVLGRWPPAGRAEGGHPQLRLAAAGVEVGIITDHPVVPVHLLHVSAALAVREGLDPAAALRADTIVPARVLGLDDRLGSPGAGQARHLLRLVRRPLDARSRVEAAWIEGRRVYGADPGNPPF